MHENTENDDCIVFVESGDPGLLFTTTQLYRDNEIRYGQRQKRFATLPQQDSA